MNKERLLKILSAYNTVTGIELSLLDSAYRTVISVGRRQDSFCSYVHLSDVCLGICRASDIEKLNLASRRCEEIVFTCPFGITEAIVPIIRHDKPIAYFFATLGVLKETQSTCVPLPKCLSRAEADRLKADLKSTTESEVQAHLVLLRAIAESIAQDPSITEVEENVGGLIKEYIKRNLTKKISLSDIAWHLHCSTVTLTQSFKGEFGITIVDYITKKRMELARRLLLSTDEPVSKIAESVGFADSEYFSRLFKKHHGAPPTVWRESNRE